MDRPFSFAAAKPRRPAMTFGYDTRPTIWQRVASNAHLVVAAVGTATLVGLAGIALWLAMPAEERQAFADTASADPEQPGSGAGKTTSPAVTVARQTASNPAVAAVDPAPVALEPRTAPRSDKVSPQVAVMEAAIPALQPNDPRWTSGSAADPEAAKARQAPDEAAPAEAKRVLGTMTPKPAAGAAPEGVAAFAADVAVPNPKPDVSETAAISPARPQPNEPQAAEAESGDQKATADTRKAEATSPGRILKYVTMRARPQKNAPVVMGSVPANASVEVVSCDQWCQIVYKGKRGWIYKSYLKRGG